MSKRRKELQDEEQKREERRNFLKWVVIGIAAATVNGVLESRQVGLVSTIWRWTAERRDLYLRASNALVKQGLNIDKQYSPYFPESENLIVYLPDFHTEEGIPKTKSKLEQILDTGLEFAGIGLEGIPYTASKDDIKALVDEEKKTTARIRTDSWLSKESKEIKNALLQLEDLFLSVGAQREDITKIMHKLWNFYSDEIYLTLDGILATDKNPLLRAPGLAHGARSSRVMQNYPVFGLENETVYRNGVELTTLGILIGTTDAIRRFLEVVDIVEEKAKGLMMGPEERARCYQLFSQIKETIEGNRSLCKTKAEKRYETCIDQGHVIDRSDLADADKYFAKINPYIHDYRSRLWLGNILTIKGQEKGRVYVVISGAKHSQSFVEECRKYKQSIITISPN